jgi:hypothetical protein
MYTYNPPEEVTRLPDSIKHNSTSVMRMAHSKYAMKAALPK